MNTPTIERVLAIHWTFEARRRAEGPARISWLVALKVPEADPDPLSALRAVARRLSRGDPARSTFETALFGVREEDLAAAGLRRLSGVAHAELELTVRADEPLGEPT
ncbi:MAG: hypothetical protein M0004_03760 [Actinomycetota bacterium]|nr:hypothetical protein [Actinomycetota bacterium]